MNFVIDFDREALRGRIADLRSKSLSDDAIRKKYFVGKGSKKYPPGDSRGWKLPAARRKIREDDQWDERYAPVLYRPFDDSREMYYVPWMVDWPRTEPCRICSQGRMSPDLEARSRKTMMWRASFLRDVEHHREHCDLE